MPIDPSAVTAFGVSFSIDAIDCRSRVAESTAGTPRAVITSIAAPTSRNPSPAAFADGSTPVASAVTRSLIRMLPAPTIEFRVPIASAAP